MASFLSAIDVERKSYNMVVYSAKVLDPIKMQRNDVNPYQSACSPYRVSLSWPTEV